MHFSRFPATLVAAALTVGVLTACGQKGSLFLRDNPPAGTKIPKPPAPKPIPYPADVTEPAKD